MAKRKHAAALFEVFNDHKPKNRSASASRASNWWFKGRQRTADSDTPMAVDENDPTTMTIRSPLIAPRIAAVEAMEPVAPPKVVAPPKAVAPPQPVVAAPPPASRAEPRDEMAVLREKFASAGVPAVPQRFSIDPSTREVTMRLPFNTAVISAFTLLLCLGIAYVWGRHNGHRETQVAVADVDNDLAAPQSQVQPVPQVRSDALNVPRRAAHTPTAAPTAKPAPRVVAEDTRPRDRDSAPVANTHGMTLHTTEPAADEGRIIGLNYLLVKNYPNQASAIEARDFLVQNGIGCTIEKVPAGYYCPDPAWVSVITTRGFDKEELHSAEYDAFKQRIEKLGEKFAGTGKFKQFSLQAYRLK